MIAKELGTRSLRGLWVGDCIGNSCQLYNIHDVLKALKKNMQDVSAWTHSQFKYSDDTEEAIVLYNHIIQREKSFNPAEPIDLDKLAMEFATRYVERDGDGETFGYGLMTRKVLRDIYEGVPWAEANKTFRKQEGTSSPVDAVVSVILNGTPAPKMVEEVNKELAKIKENPFNEPKVGSCGNGAAMRVAPLGALLSNYTAYECARAASLSALPTHDHPEGIAGAMAVAQAAWRVARRSKDPLNPDNFWQHVLSTTPQGQVYKGLMKASMLDLNTQLGVAVQILGNGTHVTCQDTVPLCCWLAIRGLTLYNQNEGDNAFEKIIEDTTACGGDVDTTAAIVGGIVGSVLEPPFEWVNLCVDMEDVVGQKEYLNETMV